MSGQISMCCGVGTIAMYFVLGALHAFALSVRLGGLTSCDVSEIVTICVVVCGHNVYFVHGGGAGRVRVDPNMHARIHVYIYIYRDSHKK